MLISRLYIFRINNGVYKAGFATTQAAYDEHVTVLFERLNKIEALLGGSTHEPPKPRKYLCGPGEGTFTEADLR